MSTYANYYYYAAAVATAIAGVLHILLFSNTMGRNPMTGVFFLIGGLAQLFYGKEMGKNLVFSNRVFSFLVLIVAVLILAQLIKDEKVLQVILPYATSQEMIL